MTLTAFLPGSGRNRSKQVDITRMKNQGFILGKTLLLDATFNESRWNPDGAVRHAAGSDQHRLVDLYQIQHIYTSLVQCRCLLGPNVQFPFSHCCVHRLENPQRPTVNGSRLLVSHQTISCPRSRVLCVL